ncbi:MAG: InlB B-repeat-containing protein [Erysipelotrichales bacterium]|nr:InlB B-repeat-containing protein [Erysipelotrichales bacterium]
MQRKKNGFTLIELLAVIVVLALIMIIVIPNVLDTTNKAKKESFYLYAQSIQSKALAQYTQDMDDETINESCLVYDIGKDLGLKNTGDYEGWIKVNRIAVNDSEKKSASIPINSTGIIAYVNYCTEKGTSCEPNKSYNIDEGEKTVTVTQTLRKDQVLCVNYQYESIDVSGSTSLQRSNNLCVTYVEADSVVSSYDYDIVLTMKSRDYGVQGFNFTGTLEGDSFKTKFYNAMNDYAAQVKKNNKDKVENPAKITFNSCSGEPLPDKGTTGVVSTEKSKVNENTTKNQNCPALEENNRYFNIILNANGGTMPEGMASTIRQCGDCETSTEIAKPTREGYIFEGWYYDKSFSENKKIPSGYQTGRINKIEKKSATGCLQGYEDVYLYAKWSTDPSMTTTTGVGTVTQSTTEEGEEITSQVVTTEEGEVSTTYFTTTTRITDVTDTTLLLDTLNVSGYSIDFSPIRFDYEVIVPYSETSVGVSATAHSPETSSVSITGNNNLSVGNNTVAVTVTNNETLKSNLYIIIVARLDQGGNRITQQTGPIQQEWDPESGMPDPSLDESNASLKYLLIAGSDIQFDPNIYEYDVVVETLDDLKLSYETMVKGAHASVDGNSNLQDESVVQILVRSVNGYYTKTYKLKIRYNKILSENTKYLRTLTIILVVILGSILIITRTNKKHGGSIFKKKSKNTENNSSQTNTPEGPSDTNNNENTMP